MSKYQRLDRFIMPPGFRGRSGLTVQFWWIVQATLFRFSPQIFNGWRVAILRFFGARIGVNVVIRPTVTITYPWKVSIGDFSWIGDDVVIYSLGDVYIGSNSVVSQRSYLCAGDHDYEISDFPIRSKKISVGNQVWIATDVFVAPGVSVNDGVVIGARSSVFHDMPEGMICFGSPCKPIKQRIITHS